jgi:predicted XRE-type DNA-binding protein
MEVWKKIEGFENYEVSNLGNVKSLNYKRSNLSKLLKYTNNNSGYRYVVLSKNNIQKTFLIHRLVALSFLKNPQNKKCVNHKNEIKKDNNLENLEWATHSENSKYSLKTTKNKNVSENHWNCKLSKLNIKEILNLINKGNISQKEIAKKYNVNQSTISDIKNKKIRFKYE